MGAESLFSRFIKMNLFILIFGIILGVILEQNRKERKRKKNNDIK